MTPPQSLSDAAHRDPSRNIAAKLMRLAESWIEPPNRRWDRLEQMDRLVASLRQTYAQELERREAPEPVGVGMSDKTLPATAHQREPDALSSIRVGAKDLPVRINGAGCCVVSRFDLPRLPGRLVRVDCLTCGGWYAEGARYEDMPCKGKPQAIQGAAP